MIESLIFAAWIICGVYAAAMFRYDFVTAYPEQYIPAQEYYPGLARHTQNEARVFIVWLVAMGPIGLTAAFMSARHYGLMFRWPK